MSTVSVSPSPVPAGLPEQLALFDCGLNLSRLREKQGVILATNRAPLTVKAYAFSWSLFTKWCLLAGRESLPASLDTVRLFVAWCMTPEAIEGGGYRLGTVKHALAAIAACHRDAGFAVPVDASVRVLLQCAARLAQEEPGGKLALTPSQLARASSACSTDALGLRDRAILVVGFATGWRASDLSILRLADVRWVERGFELYLRKSKNDQLGKGRRVGIPPGAKAETDPVRALKAWLAVRGNAAGPLFPRSLPDGSMSMLRLSPTGICGAVKRALDRVGIDSGPYGAHSLRAGFVTAAADAGASELSIMRRTGLRSTAMVLRYVRPAQAFAVDPLAGVL